MNDYRYGDLLVSRQETKLELAISGKEVTVPAGNKVVVGFDGFAHHLRDGRMQAFEGGTRLHGFSSSGVIEAIMNTLSRELPFEGMLEAYDVTEEEFRSTLEYALDEIGLHR